MKTKFLALVSVIIFIASYAFFLKIAGPVYTPDQDVNYLIEIAYSLITVGLLSAFISALIWIFKRSNYLLCLLVSVCITCGLGIALLQFMTFLIVKTSEYYS